jgi:hypothetical protein
VWIYLPGLDDPGVDLPVSLDKLAVDLHVNLDKPGGNLPVGLTQSCVGLPIGLDKPRVNSLIMDLD